MAQPINCLFLGQWPHNTKISKSELYNNFNIIQNTYVSSINKEQCLTDLLANGAIFTVFKKIGKIINTHVIGELHVNFQRIFEEISDTFTIHSDETSMVNYLKTQKNEPNVVNIFISDNYPLKTKTENVATEDKKTLNAMVLQSLAASEALSFWENINKKHIIFEYRKRYDPL